MRISVIFSTYNSPLWLEKVFWGYHFQKGGDFEIVVADDGSDERTRQVLDRMRAVLKGPVVHVWQEDEGFRKARILNQAIQRASGDYIVFSDGDCIPRGDFVDTHRRQARPGRYLSGSYIKLPMGVSERIDRADIESGRCFDLRWLREQGMPPGRKARKLAAGPALAPWLNRLTPTRCNLKGSNASAWKDDLLAVNGFDERMPWGGVDRELGVRLGNYGIRPKHVRYDAIVIHLDHARGYVDPQKVEANRALRRYNEKHRVTYTEYGIKRKQS